LDIYYHHIIIVYHIQLLHLIQGIKEHLENI